jgi:hypothetical protein
MICQRHDNLQQATALQPYAAESILLFTSVDLEAPASKQHQNTAMGYSEQFCQLCGVGFNIARVCKPGETILDSWDFSGNHHTIDSFVCSKTECRDCIRVETEYGDQVIAGPTCVFDAGYNGHVISTAEMEVGTRHARRVDSSRASSSARSFI